MAQGIPGVLRGLVAGVLPPRNAVMGQVCGDLLPGKIQQGAYNGQSVGPRGNGRHAVNSGSAAAQVKQGRLLLVVPVVGQRYERARMGCGPLQEKLLPCMPCRFLKGHAPRTGHGADVRPFPNAGNSQGGGILAHELRLLLRLRTQAVVHVAGYQVAALHAGQEGEKGHGIPSAADAGQDGTSGTQKLRRLAVKMVRCQHHAAASETGKRDKEKPSNKKPRFPQRKRGWKTVGTSLTC